jgi:hypothetical protein
MREEDWACFLRASAIARRRREEEGADMLFVCERRRYRRAQARCARRTRVE